MAVSAENNKNHINNRLKRRALCVVLCSFVVLLLIGLVSLCAGSVRVTPLDVWKVVLGDRLSAAAVELCRVRLPRLLAAVSCGAALSCSGALIQSVLRNPLGAPSIIGVNAGAGLAVVLCAALIPQLPGVRPIAAFAGAFFSLLLVFALGRKARDSRASLLLAGVAVSTFFAAVTDAVTVFVPNTIYGQMSFRIGTLAGVQMKVLIPASEIILGALLVAYFIRNELDVLSLGDETSAGLGLPVGFIRFFALLIAALLAGAGVSFAGLTGFIGLVVPHCARLFVGNEMRHLLPVSVLFGSVLMIVCDLVSRILFVSFEFPVGIILTLIGGPFFIWLLLSGRRRSDHD